MYRALSVVAVTLAALFTAPTAAAQEGWTYNSTKNEMPDAPTFFISATSASATSAPGENDPGTLFWRCSTNGGRDVLLLLGKFFGGSSDHHVLVTYRFDSEPASKPSRWIQSTDKEGTFVPARAILSFTERAIRGNRLSIRVTDPLDSESITYTFQLQGFTAAYRRLEANCPRGVLTDTVYADQVYAEAVVEVKPEMLSGPPPEYPMPLRIAGIEGQIVVRAVIDTMGRAEPNSLQIIGSPDPRFDEPVKSAVMRAQFRPARVQGRAVRVLVAIPYNFSLKKATGPGTGGEDGHISPPAPRGAILPPLEGAPRAVQGRPHRVTWWVAADGRVERVEVEPPIQDEQYRRKFLARMRSYKFEPARTRDGRSVPGVVTIPVKP